MKHRTAAGKLSIIATVVLSACTSMSDPNADSLKMAPTYRAGQSAPTADSYYIQGRNSLTNAHFALSAELFKAAIGLNPKHADAHNGLGVAYGQLGRSNESIEQFKLAVAQAPKAAHIYNNLGVAQLRAHQYDDATRSLDRALALDPRNVMARENLALVAQERPVVVAATTQIAKSPAQSDGVNYQVVGAEENKQSLVEVSPNFYELRSPTAVAVAQPEKPVVVATAPEAKSAGTFAMSNSPVSAVKAPVADLKAPAIRRVAVTKDKSMAGLEISNGVGVSRLANRTARQLESSGLIAVRLTDDRPFQQAATEIHYREGYLDSAKKLQATLPLNAKLIKAANLHPNINVRLVIGRDMVGRGEGAVSQKAVGKVGMNDVPQAKPDMLARRDVALDLANDAEAAGTVLLAGG